MRGKKPTNKTKNPTTVERMKRISSKLPFDLEASSFG